jgi:hypothetical protein
MVRQNLGCSESRKQHLLYRQSGEQFPDMLEDTVESIGADTVADYLNALNRLFILDDQHAFNPNFPSSIRVGKFAKGILSTLRWQ